MKSQSNKRCLNIKITEGQNWGVITKVTRYKEKVQNLKHDILNQPARQCTYECDIEERQSNHRRSGKAISISYSECRFLLLDIRHAIYVHMCHITLSNMACRISPNFSVLSHKWQECLFSFSFGVLQYECSTY